MSYEIMTGDIEKFLNNFRRRTVGYEFLTPWVNQGQSKYPPYDIEQVNDNTWNVTVAVAGFKIDEIEVTENEGILTINGHKEEGPETRNYTYKGIAARGFNLDIRMGEHTHVDSATCEDGLLNVTCVRELPEELKPRRININQG